MIALGRPIRVRCATLLGLAAVACAACGSSTSASHTGVEATSSAATGSVSAAAAPSATRSTAPPPHVPPLGSAPPPATATRIPVSGGSAIAGSAVASPGHAVVTSQRRPSPSASPSRNGATVTITNGTTAVDLRVGDTLVIRFDTSPWTTPTSDDSSVLQLTSTTTRPDGSVATATFSARSSGHTTVHSITHYACEPMCKPPDRIYELSATIH